MSKPVLPTSQNTQNNAIRTRATLLEHRPTGGAFEIKVFSDTATVTVGEGVFIMCVPQDLGGTNLSVVDAFVSTVSSSGKPTVAIRNITQAHDMLSTSITIDASEFTSGSASVPSVINQSNNAVAAYDLIAIDIDVAGTGAKGLGVMLEFS